jgi:NAD(P)H-dependent FMN reductase
MQPRILVFAGSLRSGSYSTKLAGAAVKDLARMDVPVTHISLGDYPLPIYDADLEHRDGIPAAARRLHDDMLAHRGIYIATPEYNASIPPLLKNTIDWVSRVRDQKSPFRHSVFALGATSASRRGGMRALIALRQVLELGLSALVIPEQVAVHDANHSFDEAGDLSDEVLAKMLRNSLQRLVTLAHADI